MSDWRDRLVVQFWGQARDLILAYARENNVSKWGAARMLVCKGAGVEYVRPKRGRAANGYRTVPKRLTPEELHACRVRQGKLLHGEDYVRLPREEVLRRKREAEARRVAAAAAREGREYEYRPRDAAWKALHDRITAACAVVPRMPGTTDQAHRSRCRWIVARADAAGLSLDAYLERLLARKRCALSHEEVSALAARIPEKLRTKTRIKKLRSLLANGKTPEEALAWCSEERRGKYMADVWAERRAAGLARPVTVREQRARRHAQREAIRAARAASALVAQARSCAARHERLLARFAAVVPEAFRARYAGREQEVMKRWRKAARKHGMTFEDYVAALMAAKAANPDGNPRVAENLTPARLAALEAGNEKRLAMAREREEARRKAREEAERERAAKRALVEMLPEGMRTAARKRELLRRVLEEGQDAEAAVATILANGAVRKNAATHPWHRAVKPVAVARKEEPKKKPTAEALAKQPAPAQATTTSRFRNCATCAHGGLLKCRAWPSLRAVANLVCEHYASDMARPSARELGEDFDAIF